MPSLCSKQANQQPPRRFSLPLPNPNQKVTNFPPRAHGALQIRPRTGTISTTITHHSENLQPHRATRQEETAAPSHRLRSRAKPTSCHGVPAEQQPDRHPQHHHLPALGAHPGRRHLAGHARRRHRVRALPVGARHRSGRLPHGRLHRGARRRLLPRDVAPLGVPPRHVRAHRGALLLHRLRVRRDQQGRRGGRVRARVQGVPPRGLLQLAAEAGGQQQELEQDQELPPGRQGLQEPAGQEPDLAAVHLLRPLPHRVRLLQAPHQLRLHLCRRHGVDQDHHQLDGPGLHRLEQRRRHGPLLRLPVVQGRRGGHLQAGLEARRRRQHRLPRLHRHRLLRRLLRLQEQPQGQRLPWRVEGRSRIRLIHPCLFGGSRHGSTGRVMVMIF